MGKVADGDGGSLPVETEGTTYTRYIENQFALTDHPCATGARCRKLGCDRSYMWQAARVPPLKLVDKLLLGWNAYRNKLSKLARGRQIKELNASTKRESVASEFPNIVHLIKPFRDITILCDWDQTRLAEVYDEVTMLVGSTVVATKTLHFLILDLFVILDRTQSYPPLRCELHGARCTMVLPRHIDAVGDQAYFELMSYIRDELSDLISNKRVVRLKDGTKKKITGVNDSRWLSLRNGENGRAIPGTICKVVDNFFPAPGK